MNISQSAVIANQIEGDGNFTKAGSGDLLLTGNNTYTGTTLISGGTLGVGNGGTLGSGAVIDNADLQINRTDSYKLSDVVSNPSGITGNGNFWAYSQGDLSIDRPIDLSAGNGIISASGGMAKPRRYGKRWRRHGIGQY